MKSKLFCVRDQKVGVFAEPFPSPTAQAALRGFGAAVQQGSGDIAKFPADFDLYEVGVYDCESGTLVGHPTPIHISSALAFVVEKSNGPLQS